MILLYPVSFYCTQYHFKMWTIIYGITRIVHSCSSDKDTMCCYKIWTFITDITEVFHGTFIMTQQNSVYTNKTYFYCKFPPPAFIARSVSNFEISLPKFCMHVFSPSYMLHVIHPLFLILIIATSSHFTNSQYIYTHFNHFKTNLVNIFSLPMTSAEPGPNILIVKLFYFFFIPLLNTLGLYITVFCNMSLHVLEDGC